MPFLKTIKNRFYNALMDLEIDTKSYQIIESTEISGEYKYDIITFKNLRSNYFFRIRCDSESFGNYDCCHTMFAPGDKISDYVPINGWGDFEYVLDRFYKWVQLHLNRILEEFDTPDLLGALMKKESLITINDIDFDSTEAFSLNEIQLIKQGMSEIKTLILEQMNFSKGEFEIVSHRIEYLENGLDRLSKTDWKNILSSTIISIIITLSLDTEKGRKLYELFINIIDNIPYLSH